jgi:hypothetical protein
MNDTPTTMKAYDANQVWVCGECGMRLSIEGPGVRKHPKNTFMRIKINDCPHAGKLFNLPLFNLPMVELEEVKPS